MGAMASQNTSFTIVYSAVYSGEDQRNYRSSESLAFVRGIYRLPKNSPHKGPVTRKMFPFDDVNMRKLSIIGPMLGNQRSSVDSPYKGPATREAFWCHCVMMQASGSHSGVSVRRASGQDSCSEEPGRLATPQLRNWRAPGFVPPGTITVLLQDIPGDKGSLPIRYPDLIRPMYWVSFVGI